jgi:hypothetical protein
MFNEIARDFSLHAEIAHKRAQGRDPDFRVIGSSLLTARLVLRGDVYMADSRFCPA